MATRGKWMNRAVLTALCADTKSTRPDAYGLYFWGRSWHNNRAQEWPRQVCCVCKEGWRDHWPYVLHIECSLLYSSHFQSFALCLRTSEAIVATLLTILMNVINATFIRGWLIFYFALRQVWHQFRGKLLNAWGAMSVWVNTVYTFIHTLAHDMTEITIAQA